MATAGQVGGTTTTVPTTIVEENPSEDLKPDGLTRQEQSLERSRGQIKALDARIRQRQAGGNGGEPLGGFRKLLDHTLLVCWLITESLHTVGELLTALASSVGVALYLLVPIVLMLQGKMTLPGAAGVMGFSTLGTVGGFAVRSRRSEKRRHNKG